MERRKFLTLGSLTMGSLTLAACGGTTSVVTRSRLATGKNGDVTEVPLDPKEKVYTSASPGPWAGKEESHLPKVSIENGLLKIENTHPMEAGHYIERHIVKDKSGRTIGENIFSPETSSAAVSLMAISLPPDEEFYVLSVCNEHGTWRESFATPNFAIISGLHNLFYTEALPGKWTGKEKTHLPSLSIESGMLKVTTEHVMEENHYISRHVIKDGTGLTLGEIKFDPLKDKEAVSYFSIALPVTTEFYVLSECNLHEVWLHKFNTAEFAKGFSKAGFAYSKDHPGPWAEKAEGHAPTLTAEPGYLKVETNHGMSMEHYISRHYVLSGSGEVLAEQVFDPSTDTAAISLFSIPLPESTVFYVASECNLHGMWLEQFNTVDFRSSFSVGQKIYTPENLNRWAGKEAGHMPTLTLENGLFKIVTNHVMTPEHYISRHQIKDSSGHILAERVFDPSLDKEAVSFLQIPRPQTPVFIVSSECNLHNVWQEEFNTTDFMTAFASSQIFYSSTNPGPWTGKEAGHTPAVVASATPRGLSITTTHEMTAEHYIARHFVKDGNGVILADRMLTPGTDTDAVSIFRFAAPTTTTFTVFSECNLHGVWYVTLLTADYASAFG